MWQSREVQVAISSVRQASRLVAQAQAELVGHALTKEDRSPVTVADFAAQAVVSRQLDCAFPHDVLVAEECADLVRDMAGGEVLNRIAGFVRQFEPHATPEAICEWIDRGGAASADRFWTLDPIDGTKGFLRGGQYAVALALVEGGRVTLGVLGCPNLHPHGEPLRRGSGALMVAMHGGGAWTSSLLDEGSFSRLHVSPREHAEAARVLRSLEESHTNRGQIEEFTRHLGTQHEPLAMDSQAKFAVLAAGGGDLLMRLLSPSQPDYREKIWDIAAGALIVTEAGGRVSDLRGFPLDFTTGRMLTANRGLLASNGRLHDVALRALEEIGAAPS
jgi:3'(2'), 5'-bisphosphate nucleotidase